MDATYNLIPEVDSNDWAVEMKDGEDQIDIPRSQPEASLHNVVVVVTPGATTSAKLKLKVEAESDPEHAV